jgi:DNA-binding NarL/FixJ family response regulator
MMSPIPQIAVVEQHSLMRRGLESLLSSNSSGTVGPVIASPSELPAGQSWDVIVYGAPAQTGPPSAEAIAGLARSGRVLVIADFGWHAVTDALRSGAFGCVSRKAAEDELLRAVETVGQGGLYVSPGLANRLHMELQNPAEGPERSLTHREQEALRWLAMGLTHGQIARRMGLTETTVSTYVKRIRSKLNVGNKADLTRKAIEMGLVQNVTPSPVASLPGFPPAA